VRSPMPIWIASMIAILTMVGTAYGGPVSYVAHFTTSKSNPVTDVLILESDGSQVHATIYGSDLPGSGPAVITHSPPFMPSQSLVIGLTQGMDADGNDKAQLVMFLDDDFAAANAGLKFSTVFPGARHSLTIASLQAAVAGDTTELAWFTDTFFTGPAAGAAFATGGSFKVAEFTALSLIGASAAAGNWIITDFESLPYHDPNAQSGKVTAVIDETAQVDLGPFDIKLTLNGDGVFAIDKSVSNHTGRDWGRFVMELGTGSGTGFVPSTASDGIGFDEFSNNRDDSGAFANVFVEEDRIQFAGFLAEGDMARFVVFITTNTQAAHRITLRQRALPGPVAVPALNHVGLIVMVLMLLLLGSTIVIRRDRS